MNTEQQLAVEGEAIVVTTVLDNPVAKLPPNICTALAYAPDFWDSVEAREIARGINYAMRKGRPTHRAVVKTFMAEEYRKWLEHPMFVESWLPLGLAEVEARFIVGRVRLTVYPNLVSVDVGCAYPVLPKLLSKEQ